MNLRRRGAAEIAARGVGASGRAGGSGRRGSGVGLAEARLGPLDVVTLASCVRADVADLLGERIPELGELTHCGLDLGSVAPRGEGRGNRAETDDTDDHPYGHFGSLLRCGSTDQGHQFVKPPIIGQEHVEVEEVVGCEGRPDGAVTDRRRLIP